jgi:thermostable 8-oxoguanine DNA glycosylase
MLYSKNFPISILDFAKEIRSLPVRNQTFTTKRRSWRKTEHIYPWLVTMNDHIFGTKDVLKISRQDIFETADLRSKLLKVIYWGYYRGMRGNHFSNILSHFDRLSESFGNLLEIPAPTADDYRKLQTELFDIPGLGLSTSSKIFYFLNLSFDQDKCLILDRRLIGIFAQHIFIEFEDLSHIRYHNAPKYYLRFLESMKNVATKLEVPIENLEMFLYEYSRRLKRPLK